MNNKDKISNAYHRANGWLAEANIAIANNKSEKRIALCERKAQYWLDRLNTLEGLNNNE